MEEISPEEMKGLLDNSGDLIISKANRRIILTERNVEGDREVDEDRVRKLRQELEAYLKRHMADRPGGHKWIILACLLRAFIDRKPLHPREAVHYTETVSEGRTVYSCKWKDSSENSLCRYCVCFEDGAY
ncbi:MAG: DUF2115 family protein [Lachnospiraceae bacterium]|nr:DUF2115 family protein [Lachnospiraceae bacterium]